MGLNLYKVDGVKGGDCINCLKCTEVCPRKNANINILGQDVNQNLAGSFAMAAMLGVYGLTNFGADALSNSGIISNNSTISSNATQSSSVSESSSQKYKDGTYTGSGEGYRGGITKVSVTVSGGKITDIKTVSNQDTPKFYKRVESTIMNSIISKQSASVDTVSGATFSSKGIMSAVENALSQAAISSTDNSISDKTSETQNSEAVASQGNESTTNSTNSKTSSSAGEYKDGTYTGSGAGYRGGTTKVSVNISGGKITGIKTVSNQDTPKFYQRVENTIMNSIISKQSTAVDTVSGATYSSKGIMSAVANALSQAK
jgi:uncharacterized protein with FMN-binding domain